MKVWHRRRRNPGLEERGQGLCGVVGLGGPGRCSHGLVVLEAGFGAWPRPEQGPAGLAEVLGRPATAMGLTGLVPLAIERPGPSWYRPGQEPATRALLPLLGAGWIAPP